MIEAGVFMRFKFANKNFNILYRKEATAKASLFLFRELSQQKFLLFLSFSLAICAAICRLYIPLMVGSIIDLASEKIVDLKLINSKLFLLFFLSIFTSLFQYFLSFLSNRISYTFSHRLRKKIFAKIQTLSISTLDKYGLGNFLPSLTNEIDNLTDGLLLFSEQFFIALASVITTIIFMYSVNWKMASIVVFISPLSLLASKYIAKYSRKYFNDSLVDRVALSDFSEECINELRTIKVLSIEDNRYKQFQKLNKNLRDSSLRSMFISSLSNPASRFINSLVYASIAIIAALLVINNHLTIGIFVSFLAYAQQYSKPFNDISQVISELQNSLAIANKFDKIFNEKSSEDSSQISEQCPLHNSSTDCTKDLTTVKKSDIHKKYLDVENKNSIKRARSTYITDIKSLNQKSPESKANKISGAHIQIKNISFAYDEQDEFIHNLSLDIPAAAKIAIVGETGSGKSTLVNLLLRFYNIKKGDILIDNQSIYSMSLYSLREKFAYVPQENFIKRGTIMENIKFSRNISDDKCIQAAKEANADDFIRDLPKAYNYFIDDSSILSEGQKQLLALSRLLTSDADIVILDEASSSIDSRNELLIKNALNKLMKNKTSIIIAHRLQSILDSDLILMVKDGSIIEIGNHDQLIKLDGEYKKLYDIQYSEIYSPFIKNN